MELKGYNADNQNTFIKDGYMLKGAPFYRITDAASYFGKTFKPRSIWTGGINHPIDPNVAIWFPKLFKNKKWDNWISEDRKVITEKLKLMPDESNSTDVKNHFDRIRNSPIHKRIVFGKHHKNKNLYVLLGVYELSEESDLKRGLVWNVVDQKAKIYEPI